MDTSPNVGNDLVRIHKVITRALNVSIQNSRSGNNITGDLLPGFTSYVRSLVILLHAHHMGEDQLAFPFWKTRLPSGPFDELSKQHGEMIPFLEQIERCLETGLKAGGLEELHRVLPELFTLWGVHIALEEDTVGPEQSRKYLSPSENEQLSRQLAEHGQAHSQPGELVMPFIVFNLPDSDRAEFMKVLPSVVSSQLIPVTWKPAWEPMIPFLLVEKSQ